MKALFLESLPYRSAYRVGSHHYASGFVADGWDVLWLSQPLSPLHFLHPVKRDWAERVEGWRHGPLDRDGLRYYSPMTLLPTGPQPLLRSSAVAERSVLSTVPPLLSVLRREGFERPDLVWLTNPVYQPLAEKLSPQCLAMRIADDHTRFRNVPASVAALERRALDRADVVFAVARGIHDRLAADRANVVPLPNGVDSEHFVAPATEPADLAAIPAPRAVYVGALEYWFDAELLAKTARSLPDVSFVVIGPGSAEGGDLEHLPNVHLLGARPYDELPAYLQHCDIGIVPFRRDEMVDAIHPIKVYEYLAAGLPVVSTRWPELEHMGAPITMVEPDSFDAAVAGALRERPEDGRATRLAYAAANSWNERYGIVRDAVNAIITGEQDG